MKNMRVNAGSLFEAWSHNNSGGYWHSLLLLRFFPAAVFIYAAIQKIGKPLAFSDEIRMYGVLDYGPLLYLTAIILPWLELVCGLCLLTGMYLYGAALILTVLNAVFIMAITTRTVDIVHMGTPLLKVYFDCGCGFGATYAWKKLLENAVLFLMAGGLLLYLLRRGSFSSADNG
jgi:uncharacterized membrane protein YphA (DoxX/SURF4 family)